MHNQKTGASYDFVAPDLQEDAGKNIRRQFPTFGTVAVTLDANKSATVDVRRTEQIIDLGDGAVPGDSKLTLIVGEGLDAGAKCYVKFKSGTDANKVSIYTGTNFDCSLVGIAEDTNVTTILWTGEKWLSIK